MKVKYKEYNPQKRTMVIILAAEQWLNIHVEETGAASDLRGLYYGLVNNYIIKADSGKSVRNYKNLIRLMTQARQGGLIDWEHIDDKTRKLHNSQHEESPKAALEWLVEVYSNNIWEGQETFVEVWHEKATGEGVIRKVCQDLGVPFLMCRGNNSQPAMRDASERALERYDNDGQKTLILHIGDLDVNGLDMTRDIRDRTYLYGFNTGVISVKRIALNPEQAKAYDLSFMYKKYAGQKGAVRMAKYLKATKLTMVNTGEVPICELSALDNRVLQDLIRTEVRAVISDPELMQELFDKQEADREALRDYAQRWAA
jgi:hypothetical protein